MGRFLGQLCPNILPYNPDQFGGYWEEVWEEKDLDEGLHGPRADNEFVAQVQECKEEEVERLEEDVDDPAGDR